MVGGRFEGNEHQVRGTNLMGKACAKRVRAKGTLRALNPDPVPADRLEIRAQQEVDFVPRAAQLRAVETAQGSTSNNRDFHTATRRARKMFDNKERSNQYQPARWTDSLKALAARNLTTFLAGIGTGWRVLGLRPMQALRLTRSNLPMPGSLNE